MLNNGLIERLSATMRVYLQQSVRRFCTNVFAPSSSLPYDALAIKSLKFGHPTSR